MPTFTREYNFGSKRVPDMREETSYLDYARKKVLADHTKKFPSKVLSAILRDGLEIVNILDSVTFAEGIKENLIKHNALEAFLEEYYVQNLQKKPWCNSIKIHSIAEVIEFWRTSQKIGYWSKIWDTETIISPSI